MVDLIVYAIPAFVLLLAVEAISFRVAAREDLKGYEARDTRTSLSMGVGNVLINVGWKAVVLVIFAGLYELTPLRIPETRGLGLGARSSSSTTSPTTGFTAISHEVRVFWASHVVHHSSQYFNLSTALRQTWVPMTYFPFWIPIALLGFKPWMIFTMQAVSLMYQFWIHTERIGTAAAAVRVRLQHAVAPPRAPRRERRLPRPQLRRHPDRLGPAVRHVPGRGGAGALRPDEEHRHLQPRQGRVPRVRRPSGATCAATERWRDRLGYMFGGPAWKPGEAGRAAREPRPCRFPAAGDPRHRRTASH